jgi:hypothetical protein
MSSANWFTVNACDWMPRARIVLQFGQGSDDSKGGRADEPSPGLV